jgi:hypothetical protein
VKVATDIYSVSFDFHVRGGPEPFTGPSEGYKRCSTDRYSAQVYPTSGF